LIAFLNQHKKNKCSMHSPIIIPYYIVLPPK
jgi:hypothetical protein